jgi:hypothetical protein
MLGTIYSHVGNNLFPRWEQFIPTLGILYGGASLPSLFRRQSMRLSREIFHEFSRFSQDLTLQKLNTLILSNLEEKSVLQDLT